MTTEKNILITGGTGFIGTAFLNTEICLTSNVYVVGSGRTPFDTSRFPQVKFVRYDLTGPSIPNELAGVNWDCIVHLATSSTLGPSFDDFTKISDILAIDRSVLQIARVTNCKRMIWASSGAVYGASDNRIPFREDDPCIINDITTENAYRIGKIQSEYIANKFSDKYGIDVCMLRLFAFSGPDLPLNVHFALGNFVYNAILHNRIEINGSGLAVRSYMDQRDVARILEHIILNPIGVPKIVNIGSPNAYRLIDVAELVSHCCKKKDGNSVAISVKNEFDDSKSFYVPNVEKLGNFYNLKSCIGLEESIQSMLVSAERLLKIS